MADLSTTDPTNPFQCIDQTTNIDIQAVHACQANASAPYCWPPNGATLCAPRDWGTVYYYPPGFYTDPSSLIWWLIGPLEEDAQVESLRDDDALSMHLNNGQSLYHYINRNTFESWARPLPLSATATMSTPSTMATLPSSVAPSGSAIDASSASPTPTEEPIGTKRILRTYLYEKPANADYKVAELNAYDGPTFTLIKTAAFSTAIPTATATSTTGSRGDSSDDSIDAGTVVGAVLAVLILVFLIVLASWCCGCCCVGCYKKGRRNARRERPTPQPGTPTMQESVDVESSAVGEGAVTPISDRPEIWQAPVVDLRQPERSYQQPTGPARHEGDREHEEPLPTYQEPPPKYSKLDEILQNAR